MNENRHFERGGKRVEQYYSDEWSQVKNVSDAEYLAGTDWIAHPRSRL